MTDIRDDDGAIIKDGDYIQFSYGIPPVYVKAKVTLMVLTPEHNPKQETLEYFRDNFNFWKVKP